MSKSKSQIMESRASGILILMSGLIFHASLSLCLAHDNTTVHPKITASAAMSSIGLQNFLSCGYGNASLTDPPLNFTENRWIYGISGNTCASEWLKIGSMYEDIPFFRGFNHFYDPIHKIGLTDGFNAFAYSSFEWATEDVHQSGEPSYPWKIVRAYELGALTNSSKADRESSLGGMMCYLGHVIHLNQDLTVPAHVRNDNHGLTLQHGFWETWIMWTENYGRDTYSKQDRAKAFPVQTQHQGWSWWQNTAGFQKLEDFWNRNLLSSGEADALNKDAATINRTPLGLSEFCNGNFISEDSPYGEFFYFHGKHWFQFPSLAYTSQPKLSPFNLADSVDKIELRNHKEGNRLRIRKTGAGIVVTNHSALNYLAVKNTPKLGNSQMQVTLTLHDDKVLQEYHEKLIPKAIEYSAGILDYFFRGTMDVTVSWGGTNAPNFTNTVLNTSGQDFHGGTFYLFADATNGTRTQVLQTNLSDIITDPSGIFTNGTTLDILCPGSPTNKFLLVYQGTIGWTNNAALDPVDTNICIAVGCQVVWHSSFEGVTNLAEPTNGDYFAEGWHVDSGSVDFGPWGQAYEGTSLLDLDGINPGTISTNIPTTLGRTYRLSFVYSRNPDGITGGTYGGIDYPPNTPSAEVLIDGDSLGTMDGDIDNTWSDLQWQSVSYTFTATSSSTKLTFESLDDDSPFGILLDAITLRVLN